MHADPRWVSYLHCFNVRQDYYLCHEYGEWLWLDSGRPPVLKGLIQAAVCLYHLHNGNVRGAWRMWQRARQYLAAYGPTYEGIDLSQLTADIDEVFRRVPAAWRRDIRQPSEIESLQLPAVRIQVKDESLSQTLPSWHPPALER